MKLASRRNLKESLTSWCLFVGNEGMGWLLIVNICYYRSFPHCLLSTSKLKITFFFNDQWQSHCSQEEWKSWDGGDSPAIGSRMGENISEKVVENVLETNALRFLWPLWENALKDCGRFLSSQCCASHKAKRLRGLIVWTFGFHEGPRPPSHVFSSVCSYLQDVWKEHVFRSNWLFHVSICSQFVSSSQSQ